MNIQYLLENISWPVLFAFFFYFNLVSTKKREEQNAKDGKEREERLTNVISTSLTNNTNAILELTTEIKSKKEIG